MAPKGMDCRACSRNYPAVAPDTNDSRGGDLPIDYTICIRRNFYTTLVEAKSEGRAGCCAPHPKEEPTLSTTDGTYIKPIRPSGGRGRGHRLTKRRSEGT